VAGGVGCASAPAGKRLSLAPQRALLSDDAAIGSALPQLDEGVGHRITGTVVNRPVQSDGTGLRIADQLVVAGIRQATVKKWPDGLPRGAS
jgi:hypothetical protein